jgi:hypothetical protein
VKRSDCDTVFIVAAFLADKKRCGGGEWTPRGPPRGPPRGRPGRVGAPRLLVHGAGRVLNACQLKRTAPNTAKGTTQRVWRLCVESQRALLHDKKPPTRQPRLRGHG